MVLLLCQTKGIEEDEAGLSPAFGQTDVEMKLES
jgi:hypothetical protein